MSISFVDPGLLFCITLAFDIIISLVSNIQLPAINCDMFLGVSIRIFEADIKKTITNAMKADCIIWYAKSKTPTKVKKMFREKYRRTC